MTSPAPVILIGLDATEVTLLDRLCDAGELPALRALREKGFSGTLENRPPAFLSMVWPSFLTSSRPSRHGWYYNKVWRPERMRLEYADPRWLPLETFWHGLDSRDFRIALCDVPFAPVPGGAWNGIFLGGWQNHDDFGRYARPAKLWREIAGRFGRPALRPELFGAQDASSLLGLRDQVLRATEQFGGICEYLLGWERWDIFFAVFGAAHRGGHYLWDLSQIDTMGLPPSTLRTLEGACAEVYRATDAALGRVLDKAPAGARVLVFALHGMGPNRGWTDHFEKMLEALRGGGRPPGKRGMAYRLKRAVPWKLARQITTRLPSAVNHALVPLWSSRMHDWSTTRYFGLPIDINGYVRINLRGREARGIVEPGAEYDDLLSELAAAFLELRDIDTGQAVVAAVDRADALFNADAPRVPFLPDLVVSWGSLPSAASRGLRSSRCGEIPFEKSGKLFSGRSGNHIGAGWYAATGPGIAPGACGRVHDIVDLGPSVLRWLGAPLPASSEGRAIPELVGNGQSDA